MRTKVITGCAAIVILAAVVVVTTMSSGKAGPAPATGAVAANPAPTGSTPSGGAPSTTSIGETTTTLAPTTTTLAAAGGGGPRTAVISAQGAVNVAIIGDSITVLAEPSIERALRGDTVYIDAVVGSTMAEHLSNIEQIEGGGQSRDWIIELGTNDALRHNANWSADFANEVSALQTQPCVDFLTVSPRLGAISTGINEAITSAVASHPNFHAIDWGSIEFERSRWLGADHVHPTKSGGVEMAKLERTAIAACQGA